jgi:glutathionyl-hydroquinone reductase
MSTEREIAHMGLLVDGKWVDKWYPTKENGGRYQRKASSFRSWVKADGSTPFAAESGRYHLYVALACPWAHRALIFRRLKGLERQINVTIVHPHMLTNGWEFDTPEPLHGFQYMHQVYSAAAADYTGRVTVPVLWDRETRTIVNNESSEIIRMFNSEFAEFASDAHDYYPEGLRSEIDALNDFVYSHINNGVYRAGFATTQEAYEEAVQEVFAGLDAIESRLADRRFLFGDNQTEADWRLFTTLIRFDPVYVGHFKCNQKRIQDYPNLWRYTRELYHQPGIAETVNMTHIKQHYYYSHDTINPTRVVPTGPEIDYSMKEFANEHA